MDIQGIQNKINQATNKIQNRVNPIAPNADKYDVWFGLFLFPTSIILATTFPQFATPIIAAVSAFAVIYQLRHPKSGNDPTQVRHAFDDGGDKMSYGLRNFGPGEARYLQYRVRVEETGEELLKGPLNYPMHLQEGEFIDLFHESENRESCLKTLIQDVSDDSFVRFYFSYNARNGTRIPQDLGFSLERPDQDILSELYPYPEPQKIKVKELRETCS